MPKALRRQAAEPEPLPPSQPLWVSRLTGELRYCLPSEMEDHPLQHKVHGSYQQEVMRGILGDVGITNVLRAYISPTTGRLTSIDGHMRKGLEETPWPTVMLDVDDDEAAYILLLEDEVAGLSEKNVQALQRLSEQVYSESDAVTQLLHGLLIQHQLIPNLTVGEPDAAPGYAYEGSEGDYVDTTPVPAPDSNIRMCQLFLTTETYPDFERRVRQLTQDYGTTTITDTVVECLRRATD
jgi:hypothetical protein